MGTRCEIVKPLEKPFFPSVIGHINNETWGQTELK